MTEISYRGPDLDGDIVRVETPYSDHSSAVAYLHAHDSGSYMDRATAVSVIEALTSLVEVADSKEAAEAAANAALAAHAAKLRSGDIVHLSGYPHSRYTVTADEEDGYVAVVRVIPPVGGLIGQLCPHERARQFRRIV